MTIAMCSVLEGIRYPCHHYEILTHRPHQVQSVCLKRIEDLRLEIVQEPFGHNIPAVLLQLDSRQRLPAAVTGCHFEKLAITGRGRDAQPDLEGFTPHVVDNVPHLSDGGLGREPVSEEEHRRPQWGVVPVEVVEDDAAQFSRSAACDVIRTLNGSLAADGKCIDGFFLGGGRRGGMHFPSWESLVLFPRASRLIPLQDGRTASTLYLLA